METERKKIHGALLGLTVIAFIVSGIDPVSRIAWAGQVAAAFFMAAGLALTYRRFQFTTFTYVLVFFHVLILLYGGHYTYSRNPLFEYLKEIFSWQRNHYDRLGHFVQGFVPAFLFKEVYLRGGHVRKGRMLKFIVILSCLGFSGFYEILEFGAVKILNVDKDLVMGTQGDFFDSHWDMLWALIGASIAVLLIGPFHDRQIQKLEQTG